MGGGHAFICIYSFAGTPFCFHLLHNHQYQFMLYSLFVLPYVCVFIL